MLRFSRPRPAEKLPPELAAALEGADPLVRDYVSRLREQDAAARDHQQRAELILSSITEAYFALDRDFRLVAANPAALQLIFRGRRFEDLAGRSFWDAFPEGKESEFYRQYQLAFDEGVAVHFEAKSNVVGRWFETHAYPRGDRLEVYLHDATERKRAEMALVEHDALLRTLQDNLPGALYQAGRTPDGQTYFRYVSAGIERLLGVTPEQALANPMSVFGLIVEEDLPRVTAAENAAVAKLAPFDCVFRQRTVMGDVRWVHCRSAPRKMPDDSVVYDGIVIDVTDRMKAVQALRETEERFRTMADSAPVLIWVNGLDGCEFVNKPYLDFLGVTSEQALGMRWAEAVHPDDQDEYLAGYLRAFEARNRFEAVFRFRRFDGEYRWFQSVGLPRFSSSGTFLGYVGMSADVTDMKRAEESLRAADRRKDEFLAMLAHELRNPLAPILSAVEVLQGAGPPDPVLVEHRQIIDRQVRQMKRLLDDMLDVSRILRGKVVLRRERTELGAVLAQSIETSRPLLDSKRHALELAHWVDPIWLEADSVRLAQVFTNLLNNAAKFTDPGGRIGLRVTVDGCTVSVSIRDSGVGMSPEVLARAFELFEQAERSLDRSQGGLGIGLTLAKSLVELHGGTIRAASPGPGLGSEFTVRLPLPEPSLTETLGVNSANQHNETESRPLGSRRVLIVDDNTDAAHSLAVLLRLQGHDVRVAHSGVEALKSANGSAPEVVILDIGLPEMSGYEVARLIRGLPSCRDAHLIALTGYSQDRDRQLSRQAGFDHHLVKPVDLDELQQIMRLSRNPA